MRNNTVEQRLNILDKLETRVNKVREMLWEMVWKWFVTNKHATSSNGGLAAEIPSQLPIKYANFDDADFFGHCVRFQPSASKV